MKLTIAALGALYNGNMDNFIAASTPGGIEAQEAQGQRRFVASESLPIECLRCTREQLEELGIILGEPVDDLFIQAKLPQGWKKVASDHSMWSYLHDEKGRERASIFYKAAFYDRSAHISLKRFLSYRTDPLCGWNADRTTIAQSRWQGKVINANGDVLYLTEILECEPLYERGDSEEKRAAYLEWAHRKDALSTQCCAWLNRFWTEWENPLAYWG